MGGQAITIYLSDHGFTGWGSKFYNPSIAGILPRPHYPGKSPGNKYDTNGALLTEKEWTWVPYPQIISQHQFDRVAALQTSRAPRNTSPRQVNGPTLLIGLAKCAMPDCGTGMTIAAAKGGKYGYYRCNAKTNRASLHSQGSHQ